MAEIYPKLDYGRLSKPDVVQQFVDAGFTGIELYTHSEGPNSYNGFKDSLPIYGRQDFLVKSIHAPIAFKLDNNSEKFNLAYEGRIADRSLEVLSDVADFSRRHSCNEITIHSWFINPPYDITKKEAHTNMAKNLAKIRDNLKGIKILAEVSPLVLWGFPSIYDKQTVMVTKQDYKELFAEGDKHGLHLGWDADIDHMFRTAIFAELYGEDGILYFKKVLEAKKQGIAAEAGLREESCRKFLDYWHDRREEAIAKAHGYIADMLTSLHDRIGHVSITGADFVRHDGIHPEEGHGFEHIPAGYHGLVTVRDYKEDIFKPVARNGTPLATYVQDRIEHDRYLPIVSTKPIILEFSSREPPSQPRKDYDFLEQAVAQKRYLEDLLRDQ